MDVSGINFCSNPAIASDDFQGEKLEILKIYNITSSFSDI